jgi:hypothetical protein
MRILTFFMTSVFIATTFSTALAQGTGTPAVAETQSLSAKDGGKPKVEIKEFEIKNFKSKVEDPVEGGCIKDLTKEPIAGGDFGNHISFGPTVAAKAFNYGLASKRMAFNAGIGAGLSMRIYDKVRFYNDKGQTIESYSIRQIRKRCRAETFDGAWLTPDNKKVIPWISISPMVFASKSERADEIQVQPALTVGFLGELVNVGAGFNLSGPDKGHVFVLLSLGYGMKLPAASCGVSQNIVSKTSRKQS